MAQNLNYNTNTSGSKCYENKDENCSYGGRLYYWLTAMGLPLYDCYAKSCASQIGATHQGICPDGWHIPTDAEWATLVTNKAGADLKTTGIEWTSCWSSAIGQINGTNKYGFSALPGGSVNSPEGNFSGLGENGSWWSASEADAKNAYNRGMSCTNRDVSRGSSYKIGASLSVRCLKDSSPNTTPSSLSPSLAISGTFKDARDSRAYKKVKIGTQTWMAQNLNYQGYGNIKSKCYDNSETNCDKYGRLYDWETAMSLSRCNNRSCASDISAKHKGICPDGWHIPSIVEWNTLIDFLGGSSATAGPRLRSVYGWEAYPSGVDEYEFSALPGGRYMGSSYCTFCGGKTNGYWWSASEDEDEGKYAQILFMYNAMYNESVTSLGSWEKSDMISVRCVED